MELSSGNANFVSKSAIFCPVRPCNLTDDHEKQWGTCSKLLRALVLHFVAICQFKLELQPGNAQFGSWSLVYLSGLCQLRDVAAIRTLDLLLLEGIV